MSPETYQISRFYWQYVRGHKLELVMVLCATTLATICYQILSPFIIAIIFNHLVWHNPISLRGLLPLVGLYTSILFLGDVILWRLADHWHWRLEGKVTRDLALSAFDGSSDIHPTSHEQLEQLTQAYIQLADLIVYQILPLYVGILGSAAVLVFLSPLYSLVFLGVCAIYLLLAPQVTRTTRQLGQRQSLAEAKQTKALEQIFQTRHPSDIVSKQEFSKLRRATDQTYRSLMLMNWAHDKQQFTAKAGVTIFSTLALLFVIFGAVDWHMRPGTMLFIIFCTGSTVLQLFTYTNHVIRSYENAMRCAKCIL